MISYLPNVLDVAAAVILIAATFILHRSLRSSASLFLLAMVLLLFAYELLAPAILIFVRGRLEDIDEFWVWHQIAHPALLFLVALSFLRVVLVDLRPNNSFKPTPLRGAP